MPECVVRLTPKYSMLESFFVSASAVGLAEIGDRTQFLSLMLACRYRRPIPVICGIFTATLLCNIFASFIGQWVGDLMTHGVMKWVLCISFIAMAIWMLVPQKSFEDKMSSKKKSAFVAAFLGFLIAEMCDKTQFVTAALTVRYHHLLPVIIGSTIGMMLVNVPVVLLGCKTGNRIKDFPMARYSAAVIFVGEAIISFFSGT